MHGSKTLCFQGNSSRTCQKLYGQGIWRVNARNFWKHILLRLWMSCLFTTNPVVLAQCRYGNYDDDDDHHHHHHCIVHEWCLIIVVTIGKLWLLFHTPLMMMIASSTIIASYKDDDDCHHNDDHIIFMITSYTNDDNHHHHHDCNVHEQKRWQRSHSTLINYISCGWNLWCTYNMLARGGSIKFESWIIQIVWCPCLQL